MKSTKLAALLALCMTAGLVSPVLAADEPLDMAVQGSLMVTRVGGVGAGLVLGTPSACVRETITSYKDMTNDLSDKVGGKMGGKDSGPVVLVSSVFTIPAALVVGGAKGVYYGSKNAFVHGFNEPFGPESFSWAENYED